MPSVNRRRSSSNPDDYLLSGVLLEEKFVADESFLAFCRQIGVQLTPAQAVACAVAFDGVQVADLSPENQRLAYTLFGDVGYITEEQRRVFCVVAGARAGKTYVLIGLRILHLALTVPLDALAPGEVASAPIIGPDMDQASKPLRFIQGAVMNHPGLLALVVGKPDADKSLELQRGNRTVEIVIRAAASEGRTGRGSNLVGCAMEESAFFRETGAAVSDKDQFDALVVRTVLPGSQVIVVSTPWAQTGLLYDLFSANHPNPEFAGLPAKPGQAGSALAMHAATLVFRPNSQELRHAIELQYKLDPENAAREYGAQFAGAGTESFFDPLVLARCVDESAVFPQDPSPGDQVMAGADLGFSKNSSALVISHLRRGVVQVAQILEKRPQEGAALMPSEVCDEFAREIRRHGGRFFMADSHYKQTAIEVISKFSIGFADAPSQPSEAFIKARTLMREGLVKIPNHPRLLRQLREVIWRKNAGGSVQIILPKWPTGEHGDIAAAFVLSVYQQAGTLVREPSPGAGTPEADAAEVRRAQEERRARALRSHEPARVRWHPRDRS